MSMSSDTKARLEREMESMKKDNSPSGITVDQIIVNDNVQWTVIFQGEKRTAFEGFRFEGRLHFPNDYPTGAPRLFFTRNIFHPYVCPVTGLYNDEVNWTSESTVSTYLESAHQVLNFPLNHKRAVFNPHAYRLFVADQQVFSKIVEGHLEDDDTIITVD
ncbi:unnamed protein product [Orchesella dallaii]|uniref:UBC core domain-containing protein n=1 Tax=Orchesella dallaii TaxID=48710 RepID=A0ABP1QEI2_9HEXA